MDLLFFQTTYCHDSSKASLRLSDSAPNKFLTQSGKKLPYSPRISHAVFRTSSANIVQDCQNFFRLLPNLIDIRTARFL